MKIAIVSYFAPPHPAVASHRVLRLTRALRSAGHVVQWVTLDPDTLPDRDASLAAAIPADVRVHGLGGPNLVDVPVARSFGEKLLRSLVFKLPDWFAVPDRHVEWTWRLRRHLPGIVRREGIEAVIVSCGPHGQLLAIPRLRRAAPELRIVVDYRDLLSGNSWRQSDRASIRRRLLERERAVLRVVDALFVNSEDARQRFVETVGELPGLDVRVMRNTADYALARELVAGNGGATAVAGPVAASRPALRLGFFGSLFPKRRLLPLLEALAELDDAALATVQVECYCDALSSARLLAEDLAAVGERVARRVARRDLLGYADALRAMRAMDVLVLVNSPDAADTIFVPGKLYDYLMARRPILFLGCAGDASRIVAETSGPDWCFGYGEPGRVAAHLAAHMRARPADVAEHPDHAPARSFAPLLDRLEAWGGTALRGADRPAVSRAGRG